MKCIFPCYRNTEHNLEASESSSDRLVALTFKVSLVFLGCLLIGGSIASYFYWAGLPPLITFAGVGTGLIASVMLYQCITFLCSNRHKEEEKLTIKREKETKVLSEDDDLDSTISLSSSSESFQEDDLLSIESVDVEDILISEEIISTIQINMQNILRHRKVEGINFYKCQENHSVFELDIAPGLIFKMEVNKTVGDDSMEMRYQTMVNAKAVLQTNQLELLIIPEAKLFSVNVKNKKYNIIAERKLNISPNTSVQEQYYEYNANRLNNAIYQLAIFICKTGYSDVKWSNNPVLINDLDENGNLQFALIDIEEMNSAEIGLFGDGSNRRGLVRCVNEQQGYIVEKVARENRINTSSFSEAHSLRKKELEDGRKLKQYYSKNMIIRGDELRDVDVAFIDFAPYSSKKVKKLQDLAASLRDVINDQIANSSPELPVKGRRCVFIDVHNDERFQRMHNKLIEPGEDECATAISFKTDEEYYDATYLGYVVKEFIKMGFIYKVIIRNGRGYSIQA